MQVIAFLITYFSDDLRNTYMLQVFLRYFASYIRVHLNWTVYFELICWYQSWKSRILHLFQEYLEKYYYLEEIYVTLSVFNLGCIQFD